MLLAGERDPPTPNEITTDPIPTQTPALAIPIKVRDAPVAALVHHDQTGKIYVNFSDEFHKLRKLILTFNKPCSLLISKDVELRGNSLFILFPVYPIFIRTENGREIECDRFDWRRISFNGFDPREALLELLQSGTR